MTAELTVWVDGWLRGDVNRSFAVGDAVRWRLVPVEDDHLSRVVWGTSTRIEQRAERDLLRSGDVSVTGARVRRIRAVSCTHERGTDGLARPVPGSGTLLEQRCADGSTTYGPGQTIGYVVDLAPMPVRPPLRVGRALAWAVTVLAGAAVAGRLWLWGWETGDHRSRVALGAALLIVPALEVAVWEVRLAGRRAFEPTLSQLLASATYWTVVLLGVTATVVTYGYLFIAPVAGLLLWLPIFVCRVVSRTRPAVGALATGVLLLAEAAAVSHWPPWDAHEPGPWHLLSAVLAVDAVLIATSWRVRLPVGAHVATQDD